MKQFIRLKSVPGKWALHAYFIDRNIPVRHTLTRARTHTHTHTHTLLNSET